LLALAIVILLVSGAVLAFALQPSRIIHIKALILPLICLGFVICLIVMSKTAIEAVISGLKLWSGSIVPALFPFFVTADIMNSTGLINAAGYLLEPIMRPLFNIPGCGSFPYLMGITSGYPVGAKITCDYRKAGNLSKTEAERLLAYTSNSGPLFIIGGVGTSMLMSPDIGIYLYICHILATLTVGLLFRFYKTEDKYKCKLHGTHASKKMQKGSDFRNCPPDLKKRPPDKPLGAVLGDAVRNSISAILAIGGFIVIFSVVISVLNQLGIISALAEMLYDVLKPFGANYEIIKGVLGGIIEISTGSRLICGVSDVTDLQKLTALSLVIGWAGFSVHFQVLSFVSATDLSPRPYFIGKLLHSVLAALYTWVGLKILPSSIFIKEPVLGAQSALTGKYLLTFGAAAKTAGIILALSALCGLASGLIKRKAAPGKIPFM